MGYSPIVLFVLAEEVAFERYTLSYTPAADRILPAPSSLRLRIKNTSAVPLRAAYLHGPYTLHVSAYPSVFHPNRKLESPGEYGLPEYEPQLKAGGSWNAELRVPAKIREGTETLDTKEKAAGSSNSATWIIDIASQVIFSASATVHFELLVARDETSLSLGPAALAESVAIPAGKIEDHQQGRDRRSGHHGSRPKGVYSKAVRLLVDDTASLWNRPAWPHWETREGEDSQIKFEDQHKQVETHDKQDPAKPLSSHNGNDQGHDGMEKPKKVHLVILTHGLHSNLNADLLYLKESIDAAAREAREDAKKRRARQREQMDQRERPPSEPAGQRDEDAKTATSHTSFSNQKQEDDDGEESDEEVIVRGFAENVIRTERGIKYLGKRLARFVLRMVYPQQPFLPVKRPGPMSFASSFSSRSAIAVQNGPPAHSHSSLYQQSSSGESLPYEITSISFIGHSLGGLVQTYAIAYIQKHSPQFFEKIRPINFIALATPFLGLSNENPLYVKFALDFGLVGRTGQDLGLAWRAPAITRTGWSALIGGLGGGEPKPKSKLEDPGSKPLLRILPTGPAHVALQAFRNRTVYANVVNDGIVPLRTSCLLFLDWNSLGRVEKARRENGLVGTMAEWGWAELTGSKLVSRHDRSYWNDASGADNKDGTRSPRSVPATDEDKVPQPSTRAAKDESTPISSPDPSMIPGNPTEAGKGANQEGASSSELSNVLNNFLGIFLPNREKEKRHESAPKVLRMYRRSQTIQAQEAVAGPEDLGLAGTQSPDRLQVTQGSPRMDRPDNLRAPPKTSFFESAGALLSPPVPPTEFLIDPSSRPRTIFHDRVYHPSDIPPVPVKRRSTFARSWSGSRDRDSASKNDESSSVANASHTGSGGMSVEEKIARAYHRDMSWRKVLVRLEPDAHNNIIVRRMFANAYGWPVVKHLVDTHFTDTQVARTRDDEEAGVEHAKALDEGVGENGEEADHEQTSAKDLEEDKDKIGDLEPRSQTNARNKRGHTLVRRDSVQWSDAEFEDSGNEDDSDD